MLTFIVDVSTGVAVARWLENQGYDVLFVGDWNAHASDDEIIKLAVIQQRVIVTNDKDFGEKVFRDSMPHAGVLLLRLSDDRSSTKLRIVADILKRVSNQLVNNFVVATENHIRIR